MCRLNYKPSEIASNLIGEISPVVNGAGDVEPLTLVGALKRQYTKV